MTRKTRSKSKLSRATNSVKASDTGPEESPSTKANASKQPANHYGVTSEDFPSPVRENTTGLPIFPDELLLEILFYYPDTKLEPDQELIGVDVDRDAHFTRRETLKALSQTCRNLRRFLRPYIWRRIEVFPGVLVSSKQRAHTEQQVALELIRQLEIVTIRDPLLAGYVSVVNIQIGIYRVRNLFRELARCLEKFPNVHTLRVKPYDSLPTVVDRAITYGFGHYKRFPQIRSIIIPLECYGLLKYCPGVRYVYSVGGEQILSDYYASILADCCPLMENVALPLLVQQFPNIKDISLRFAGWCRRGEAMQVSKTDLDFIFSGFRHLKVIKMHFPVNYNLACFEQFRTQAKEALLGLQKSDKEKKTIIIYIHSQPKNTIILPWPPTSVS